MYAMAKAALLLLCLFTNLKPMSSCLRIISAFDIQGNILGIEVFRILRLIFSINLKVRGCG